MKSAFKILFLYVSLALFIVSCQDEDTPEPVCLQVEVIGADCDSNWYILKIENSDASGQPGNYKGQLQSGYVTTDNLPEAYKQPGLKMEATLEVNGEYAPRCVTIAVMYPAVKVTRVCQARPVQG